MDDSNVGDQPETVTVQLQKVLDSFEVRNVPNISNQFETILKLVIRKFKELKAKESF